MFDIGFSELVLIGVLALLVLGPKRLPEVARMAGRGLARLRRFVSGVKQDFDREMHNAEIMELHKLKQELDETRRAFAEQGSRLVQQLSDSGSSNAAPPVVEPSIKDADPGAISPVASKGVRRIKPKSTGKNRHGRRTKAAKRR